ncbi:MAG: diacylglycerol kinase family protein, partial [Chloroflexi bacterium]|nr:diacylglycerol kinase family protein [Chloroflexota bacterium]
MAGVGLSQAVVRELGRLTRAFRFAGRGVVYMLRTQGNARWHAVATGVVAVAAWVLQVRGTQAGLLMVAVGLVWAAEAFNTALEALADRCAPEPHPLVAAAKDAAAAG